MDRSEPGGPTGSGSRTSDNGMDPGRQHREDAGGSVQMGGDENAPASSYWGHPDWQSQSPGPFGSNARSRSGVLALIEALGLGITGMGVGFVLILAARAAQHVAETTVESIPLSVAFIFNIVLLQGVAFIGVAAAYHTLRNGGIIRGRFPTFRDGLTTVIGFGLAFLAVIVGYFTVAYPIEQLTGQQPAENPAALMGMENPEILLIGIPLAILLIGPGEELLFRGCVQGRLREHFEPVPAILVASAFFAAIHALALAGTPLAIAITVTVLFFPSLVLGAAYEYTGNIVVPSIIHGCYNATLFAVLYLAVTTDGIQMIV